MAHEASLHNAERSQHSPAGKQKALCSYVSQNGEILRAVQVSYHTHIPEYIPKYTWKGLVGPMWRVIRFNILMADLTLVPSKTMKVHSFTLPLVLAMRGDLSCVPE